MKIRLGVLFGGMSVEHEVSIITAIIYYITNSDIKIIFNSFILAPVSWSWIFKPICKKFNIDYKDINILD